MLFKKEKSKTKKSTPIFGQLWDTDYNRQAAEYFFDQSITFVENHEGLNTEGIFRLCGVKPKIEALKNLVDGDPLHFQYEDSTDVHEVTGCMKLFLREMPIPLLTYELYDAFIAATATEIETERPVIIKKCLDLLPPFNKAIFKKLCLFLNRIMQNSAITFMNAANLATCIGPNILKPESNDITIIINDAPLQCLMMSIIVTDPEKFFKSGPWVSEKRMEGIEEDRVKNCSMSLPHSGSQAKCTIGTLPTVTMLSDSTSNPTTPRTPRWTSAIVSNKEDSGDLRQKLSKKYSEKLEKERGKIQTLITPVTEQPETEEEVKTTTTVNSSNDVIKLKSDIKKRIEFFEQMVKDGGLEISPESGALVAALKNNQSSNLPKIVNRTSPSSTGKFMTLPEEIKSELQMAIIKKEKEKKK